MSYGHQFNSGTYYPWPGIHPERIIFSTGPHNPDMHSKKPHDYPEVTKRSEPVHVLLADDDADDRELFTEVLEDSGVKVELDCAVDGKNLIDMLMSPGARTPHVIFLDLNMPNKSGRECLDFIRKSERLRHIPVVIYSTSSSPKDIDDTFEKGANLYVTKPSSYNELLATIRSVLSINWDQFKPRTSRTDYVFSLRNR